MKTQIEVKPKHTPTPATVATVQYGPHAAFIAKAVNCHEELLKYIKEYHIAKSLAHKAYIERGNVCAKCALIAKAEGK